MVIENLTHRAGDFRETKPNVVAVESYLNTHKEILKSLREQEQRLRESRRGSTREGMKNEFKEKPTSFDISYWLDENTERVMTHDEVTQLC